MKGMTSVAALRWDSIQSTARRAAALSAGRRHGGMIAGIAPSALATIAGIDHVMNEESGQCGVHLCSSEIVQRPATLSPSPRPRCASCPVPPRIVEHLCCTIQSGESLSVSRRALASTTWTHAWMGVTQRCGLPRPMMPSMQTGRRMQC